MEWVGCVGWGGWGGEVWVRRDENWDDIGVWVVLDGVGEYEKRGCIDGECVEYVGRFWFSDVEYIKFGCVGEGEVVVLLGFDGNSVGVVYDGVIEEMEYDRVIFGDVDNLEDGLVVSGVDVVDGCVGGVVEGGDLGRWGGGCGLE